MADPDPAQDARADAGGRVDPGVLVPVRRPGRSRLGPSGSLPHSWLERLCSRTLSATSGSGPRLVARGERPLGACLVGTILVQPRCQPPAGRGGRGTGRLTL